MSRLKLYLRGLFITLTDGFLSASLMLTGEVLIEGRVKFDASSSFFILFSKCDFAAFDFIAFAESPSVHSPFLTIYSMVYRKSPTTC